MKFIALLALFTLLFSCSQKTSKNSTFNSVAIHPEYTIILNDSMIYGCYKGPEFVSVSDAEMMQLKGTDIAHQFSNIMVDTIGKLLKIKFLNKEFCKIDMENIRMSTLGMDNTGDVQYCLQFPIIRTKEAEAKTGFEHCGGWNHEVEESLEIRINKLKTIAIEKTMEISSKKTTPEGLIEYWIQFKHK